MILMLPRLCYTDWSGHSSLIVMNGAVGIPCGAVSWHLQPKYNGFARLTIDLWILGKHSSAVSPCFLSFVSVLC